MKIKILFIGSLSIGSTTLHRLNAIRMLYNNVYALDQQIIKNSLLLIIDRILNKIFKKTINNTLAKNNNFVATNKLNPSIIWFDKILYMTPNILKMIKSDHPYIKIIHYSPDDIMNPNHLTKSYLACIPLYDLHVTTKSYNLEELYSLGAKRVLFVNNAYAPEVHKPYDLTKEEKENYSADVSFIGGPEKERADSINYLANNGIKVTIWSNGWAKFLIKHKNIRIERGWFANEEYCKIICASKINLAFLRKVNRDLQTTRTMEIPACGGFMLAERTIEHLQLFKEDEEAVFFSNDEELKTKIEFYLSNEAERIRIAKNGLNRCIVSGYDNITMIKKVMDNI